MDSQPATLSSLWWGSENYILNKLPASQVWWGTPIKRVGDVAQSVQNPVPKKEALPENCIGNRINHGWKSIAVGHMN